MANIRLYIFTLDSTAIYHYFKEAYTYNDQAKTLNAHSKRVQRGNAINKLK
jgi:hypothetical protein